MRILNTLGFWIQKKKNKNLDKRDLRFDKKNHIQTMGIIPSVSKSKNFYQGTNISLLERLSKSEVVSTEDILWDVGCGKGKVLFYFSLFGLKKVYGTECDISLYNSCKENIANFMNTHGNSTQLLVNHAKAEEIAVHDDITVVYLFNFLKKKHYMIACLIICFKV